MPMTVTYECANCHAAQRTDLVTERSVALCGACAYETSLRREALSGSVVNECVICGTQELYIQKDFPHRLGLIIVGVGVVLSSIAWWQYWYPTALGILLATALLDLCLFYAIGDVLICYRCLAQYRGVQQTAPHKPFDLAMGERYRQERLRLEMLRNATSQPSDQEGRKVAGEAQAP